MEDAALLKGLLLKFCLTKGSLFCLKSALQNGKILGTDAPYLRVGFQIPKWHTCVQKSEKTAPPRVTATFQVIRSEEFKLVPFTNVIVCTITTPCIYFLSTLPHVDTILTIIWFIICPVAA